MGRGKMKEQGSRNGGGRGLRRIRGFGAHACRRHACGGTAPAEFRPGAGTCAPPGEYAVSLCMHGLNPEQIHFRIPTPQASNLRLAYTKPKRKSGQAALFCICLQSAQCAQAVRTHATANHIRLHCVFALALAFTFTLTFTLTFALGFLFCAEKKPSVLFRCMHEKPQVYLQMRLYKMI